MTWRLRNRIGRSDRLCNRIGWTDGWICCYRGRIAGRRCNCLGGCSGRGLTNCFARCASSCTGLRSSVGRS